MNTKDSRAWGLKLASVLGGGNVDKGGPGSGHYGHAGRPGRVGGSVPSGVRVGRSEAEGSGSHFKWSGTAELRRARGPSVRLSIVKGAKRRAFEVHGAVDAKGKPKKGKCVVRVGGDTLELDHDELHDLRSKMRYVKMTNDRDVGQIDGRDIVRGDAIEVEVSGKKVTVPVSDETVREVDRASHATRGEGYSFTGESKRQVKAAYDRMQRENPVHVVKDEGFSEAGKAAALRVYVDGPGTSKRNMERIVAGKKGVVGRTVFYGLQETAREFFAMRKMAWEAREMSDTNAAAYYQAAAVLRSKIQRSGTRKRRE